MISDNWQSGLLEFESKYHNQDWLRDNYKKFYPILRCALEQHEDHVADAINVMINIYPILLSEGLEHVAEYLDHLRIALLTAQNVGDLKLQAALWTYIGKANLQLARVQIAEKSLLTAYAYACDGENQSLLMEVFIALFSLQAHKQTPFFEDHYQEALELARKNRDTAILARLYQSLCYASLFRGNRNNIITYGNQAKAYFEDLSIFDEAANTALIVSAAYRLYQPLDVERSLDFIEYVKTNFGKTKNWRQYIRATYEQAAVYLIQKEYDVAEQWLYVAWSEFQRLSPVEQLPHYRGLIQYAFGELHYYQNRYYEAVSALKDAMDAWQVTENGLMLGWSLYALGRTEKMRGNAVLASHYFEQGLAQVDCLPMQTPVSDMLRKRIENNSQDCL